MARFRRRARRARGFFRSRRSRGSGDSKPESVLLPAAIYGAARQTLSGFATPLTNMLPFGEYNDELVMGIAGYLASKKGSGIIKQLGKVALTIEAASLGYQVVGKNFGGQTQGNSGGWN